MASVLRAFDFLDRSHEETVIDEEAQVIVNSRMQSNVMDKG